MLIWWDAENIWTMIPPDPPPPHLLFETFPKPKEYLFCHLRFVVVSFYNNESNVYIIGGNQDNMERSSCEDNQLVTIL